MWTQLTNNNEDIGMGRGLEERCLPGHLAPELAAGGQVHIPQHDPRLRRLVFLWIVQKSEFFWMRGRKGYVRDLILKVDHNMNICVLSQKARGYSEPKQMSWFLNELKQMVPRVQTQWTH